MEGKSSTALNLIYQLKKYNRDFRCKDLTKRPCIVLLTMENTVEESIERLFGIATDHERMTEFDLPSVIEMLKRDGELTLADDNPIDIIIKFKPTNSVDTGYLYTLTDDLEDQGYEVICMFQDYIGRIRSTQRLSDTRLEYGAVIDDFKVYAQIKDVPVVTLAQLNRDASKHIDEGRQKSKSDLVRSLGRSNVSESMLILNNIDGGFMITPEFTSTGEKYLGVQRVKIRYNASPKTVIYLPYSTNNTIKLLEDYGGVPNFKDTLRTQACQFADNNVPRVSANLNDLEDISTINTPAAIDESNLFSSRVVSSSTESVTMDFCRMAVPYNFEKDPMEFDEDSVYYKEVIKLMSLVR